MHTITFYSYKGGVGRTLSLANIAKRLSEFKKKVVVLDMDLEAPGLTHKFKTELGTISPEKGIVDYIYEYAVNNKVPETIREFSKQIKFGAKYMLPIDIIPAGDILNPEYWKKLSAINWHNLFYKPESEGIPFFIDLKQKIAKEFEPEYLLVDSRTGITEVSGISINVLADEVVIVASNNEENITGAKLVMQAISKPENALFGKTPKIHFVLTRFTATKNFEDSLISRIKRTLNENNKGVYNIQDIHVIHSDRDLERDEKLKIADDKEDGKEANQSQIGIDYLNLFEVLMQGRLSNDDLEKFKKTKKFQKLTDKAKSSTLNAPEKIRLLTEALELEPLSDDAYYERAESYWANCNYDLARNDFDKAIEINSTNDLYYDRKAILLYYRLNEYENALVDINKAISLKLKAEYLGVRASIYNVLGKFNEAMKDLVQAIDLEPSNSVVFNLRADLFLNQGRLDEALIDAYKSLELDPNQDTAYGTLAEIFAKKEDKNGFYLNLELALKHGYSNLKHSIEREYPEIYKPFLQEERFQKLLAKYEIELEESKQQN